MRKLSRFYSRRHYNASPFSVHSDMAGEGAASGKEKGDRMGPIKPDRGGSRAS